MKVFKLMNFQFQKKNLYISIILFAIFISLPTIKLPSFAACDNGTFHPGRECDANPPPCDRFKEVCSILIKDGEWGACCVPIIKNCDKQPFTAGCENGICDDYPRFYCSFVPESHGSRPHCKCRCDTTKCNGGQGSCPNSDCDTENCTCKPCEKESCNGVTCSENEICKVYENRRCSCISCSSENCDGRTCRGNQICQVDPSGNGCSCVECSVSRCPIEPCPQNSFCKKDGNSCSCISCDQNSCNGQQCTDEQYCKIDRGLDNSPTSCSCVACTDTDCRGVNCKNLGNNFFCRKCECYESLATPTPPPPPPPPAPCPEGTYGCPPGTNQNCCATRCCEVSGQTHRCKCNDPNAPANTCAGDPDCFPVYSCNEGRPAPCSGYCSVKGHKCQADPEGGAVPICGCFPNN